LSIVGGWNRFKTVGNGTLFKSGSEVSNSAVKLLLIDLLVNMKLEIWEKISRKGSR
jgi:hypothetical protein